MTMLRLRSKRVRKRVRTMMGVRGVQAKSDSEYSRAEENESKTREAQALMAAKGIQVAICCINAGVRIMLQRARERSLLMRYRGRG